MAVANFAETKSYLQYYLRQTRICIMCSSRRSRRPCSLIANRGATAAPGSVAMDHRCDQPKNRPLIEFGLANNLADFASVFFSMGGLSSAVRTVSVNRGQRNLPNAGSSEDGFAPIALAPHHFSVRNVFNFVLHTGFMQRGARCIAGHHGRGKRNDRGIASCIRWNAGSS